MYGVKEFMYSNISNRLAKANLFAPTLALLNIFIGVKPPATFILRYIKL